MIKNTNIVKKANQALVLDSIMKNKKITIEEIMNQTGLSRTTVLSILKDLSEKKLIEKRGRVRQSVGRQPVLYALSRDEYFVIGVDVDVAPIYLNIARLDGKSVYSRQWEVSLNANANELESALIKNIETALSVAKISRKKIIGLGLGLPGIINVNQNRATEISRIRGWKEDNCIAEVLEEKFGFPIYVRNDTHLLGHMEVTSESENMLYILHRSGIGMAPVINGEVYEGTFGNSGYIGHTRVDSKGKICNCGAKDCLELYCSKRSIEAEYEHASGKTSGYDELISLAEEGDPAAIKIFEHAGHYLGIGISNAMKTYDISNVVLGDLRCDENHVFYQQILLSVKQHMVNVSIKEPTVILSKYTKEMYGLGACQFVLENFFEQPKLHTNIDENGGEWLENESL